MANWCIDCQKYYDDRPVWLHRIVDRRAPVRDIIRAEDQCKHDALSFYYECDECWSEYKDRTAQNVRVELKYSTRIGWRSSPATDEMILHNVVGAPVVRVAYETYSKMPASVKRDLLNIVHDQHRARLGNDLDHCPGAGMPHSLPHRGYCSPVPGPSRKPYTHTPL